MRRAWLLLVLALSATAENRPATIRNDASCDIATLPAATLLLPYFEVDINAPLPTATTTVFNVTNVTREPQIAHVTLWTDLDHPVYSFPLFLTGYDQATLSLYDVIVRGVVEPARRTAAETTPGNRSLANLANPRFLPSAAASCSNSRLQVDVPSPLLADVRRALVEGVGSCGERIGRNHPAYAAGYVTIDVVATCTTRHPTDPAYWDEVLYDNVLTGDWQIVKLNPTILNSAEGGPMVHIRAIPEGGAAGSATVSPLPFTFYDRLLPAARRRTDRRQPLPSTFIARFLQGDPFESELAIWREGVTVAGTACTPMANNDLPWTETVRFDERENPTVAVSSKGTLPVTGTIATTSDLFPPLAGGDAGGWLYLNLNNGGSSSYSAADGFDLTAGSSTIHGPRQSQAWVTSRLGAERRYAVGLDATALGNGCTPSPARPAVIGPAPERAETVVTANITHRNDDSCDLATLPAATLFLPYFEVELDQPAITAATTLFTIVNTSNLPQVARATIWSDAAVPVLTFDIFLTGYDVHAVNLYDLLVHGRLGTEGWRNAPSGPRSLLIDANPNLAPGAIERCANLPSQIPPAILDAVRRALTGQAVPELCGTQAKRAGGFHTSAIGYVTIDLVSTCSARALSDSAYLDELLFDNVLTGDWQLVRPNPTTGNAALGNPLVHLRAIPEGGPAGERRPTLLPWTFYDGLRQPGPHTPRGVDRRQPLPSAFAARYIQGGVAGFLTDYLIWRTPHGGMDPGCDAYQQNLRMDTVDVVRFDQRENATVHVPVVIITAPETPRLTTSVAQRISTADREFPPLQSGDVAGWIYVNLELVPPHGQEQLLPHQGWMTVAMHAEGRFAVAYDATALGNGCSPSVPLTDKQIPIGPSTND